MKKILSQLQFFCKSNRIMAYLKSSNLDFCKSLIKQLILLSTVFIISACSPAKSHKIGLVITSSDIFLNIGISGRNGANLAIKHFNKNSEKHKIEVLMIDDRKNPEIASDFIREAYDKNFLGLIGPLSSFVAGDCLIIINKYEIPSIAPLVNIERLKNKDDYFFTMNSSARTTAVETAKLIMKDNSRNSVITILYNENSSYYFADFRQIIENELERNGYTNTFGFTLCNADNSEFEDAVEQVISVNSDAVLIIDGDLNTARTAQALKLKNEKLKLYGTEFALTERLISNGGKAVDNMKFSTTLNFDPSIKEVYDFITLYAGEYGAMPDAIAYLTYISAESLINAAVNADFKYRKIKDELLKLEKNEKKIFNEFGDRENPPINLKISKGRFNQINE